jgi:GNAT superfamily N-acetyltransferase
VKGFGPCREYVTPSRRCHAGQGHERATASRQNTPVLGAVTLLHRRTAIENQGDAAGRVPKRCGRRWAVALGAVGKNRGRRLAPVLDGARGELGQSRGDSIAPCGRGRSEAVGSASLVAHDLPDRTDLWDMWPWLSVVYVVPACRGKGVARALLRWSIGEASGVRVDTLNHMARAGWSKAAATVS